MNNFIKTTFVFIYMMIATASTVCAAHMYIDSPLGASSNREPLTLSIFLDRGEDIISGLSGDFSFPSELFDVKNISTQNGIVALWAVQPHISEEKLFDQRTHINFEGIIPGGFSGVHSPYSKGVFPGIVFTVTLIPKNGGKGEFKLDNIELHAYDNKGTMLLSNGDTRTINVPPLSGKEIIQSSELKITDNKTVSMVIQKNELVNDSSPFVYINEEDPARTIDHIEIAESSEYNPNYVSPYEWRTIKNPYVLTYTARTKYVHAKIVYTNHTYTFKTLPPVENSQALLQQSRILLYIVIAIALLYLYGKNFLHFFKKTKTEN